MSTMTREATITVPANADTLWVRIERRSRKWGRSLRSWARRVRDFFVRGARRIYYSRPVRWAVAQVTRFIDWAWYYARRPIMFVVAPAAAILFAPRAVAVMLALVLVALIIIGYGVYRTYQHMRTISSREELQEMANHITEVVREEVVDPTATFKFKAVVDSPITVDETDDTRFAFLDEQMHIAQDEQDETMFSELTGRMYLLTVRAHGDGKLGKTAPVNSIYRECRRRSERGGLLSNWDWTAMYNAVRAEEKRRKERIELQKTKAENGNLTLV